MKNIKKWITPVLVIVVLGALIAGYALRETPVLPDKYVEAVPGEAFEPKQEGLTLLASGDNMELYLDASTATIRWQDKKTGEYMDTRIFDEEVNNVALKSAISVSYYTGASATPYNNYTSMDDFTYSVELDKVSYEKLENGVRFVYSMGSEEKTYMDFPTKISEERMNELVFQYLDIQQKKIVEDRYRYLKAGYYMRQSNKDNPLSSLAVKELYNLFYEVGKYTYEDLEADNTEWDALEDMPNHTSIDLIMEYSLDGDDLVVRIPAENINANGETVKGIDFLPYFLSSKGSDGYLFVPDGSGALIYLDNTKLKEYQFTSRYWGGDVLQEAGVYTTTSSYMTAPVYGIKSEDHAVLGIIEEGAEIATLSAYINGSYGNIPYSRVGLTFAIREDQTLMSYQGAMVRYTLKKAGTDYYAGDIRVRYRYLTGEDADYSGMASCYRDYLVDHDMVAQREAEAQAPLFVEMLGEVDSTEYLLGFPYEGTRELTTFAQARSILEDMNGRGIGNIKVVYTGAANGGLNQREADKVKISSSLGGRKGFNTLIQYAGSIGAQVFPNFQLQTVNQKAKPAGDTTAFAINGQAAQLYAFDPVSFTIDATEKYPTYVVAPDYMTEYLNKFRASYKKLGVDTLASEDFMKFISPNYKTGENMSITTAMSVYLDQLKALDEEYTLALSNPISLAWPYVDYITDVPSEGSTLKVVDCYVPFMQMVLSGNMTYSTETMNNASYDMDEQLMQAIETGSAMKFRVMASDSSVLKGTDADDIFSAEYEMIKEEMPRLWQEYNEFYQQVSGANIQRHEIFDADGELVRVTWSNGVEVYLNYSEDDAVIDGVAVPAGTYQVER